MSAETVSWNDDNCGSRVTYSAGGRTWSGYFSASVRSPYNPWVLQLDRGNIGATWNDGQPLTEADRQAIWQAVVRNASSEIEIHET